MVRDAIRRSALGPSSDDLRASARAVGPASIDRHGEAMDPERQRIQDDLRGLVKGEVRCDHVYTQLYASDSSIFEIEPIAVVRPRGTSDVVASVQYAHEQRISPFTHAGRVRALPVDVWAGASSWTSRIRCVGFCTSIRTPCEFRRESYWMR